MAYSPCGSQQSYDFTFRMCRGSCRFYERYTKDSGDRATRCAHPKGHTIYRVWQGILAHHWDDKYGDGDLCPHYKPVGVK